MHVHFKKSLRWLGIFVLTAGLAVIFNPQTGVTGYVISNDIPEEPFPVFGFIAVGVGFLLFLTGLERKEKSIRELVRESLHEQPLPPRQEDST